MNGGTVQERYDQFQEQAVSNIVSDFGKKVSGRFLLVIPTGGGKTFTAVKAINRLFEASVLNPSSDRVIWTAHRTELITQAVETFERFQDLYPQRPTFIDNVDFRMIGDAQKHLASDGNVKLVIIDEAHHAALKNINYGPFFARKSIGILGLTATPSRHDGEPLEFERESFSIGFPDLVKKGIVLKPEIRKVDGGSYAIANIDDPESLEQLNNQQRNTNIIEQLTKHSDDYKKVIIYVGTVKHVTSLYSQLLKSPLKDKYESISFITGNSNSRNQDREAFVDQEKKYKRSILVNVMVLSEGYDDPSVNTCHLSIGWGGSGYDTICTDTDLECDLMSEFRFDGELFVRETAKTICDRFAPNTFTAVATESEATEKFSVSVPARWITHAVIRHDGEDVLLPVPRWDPEDLDVILAKVQ